MSLPVRSLPVLQNWDCQGCSNCCREYEISVSDEERQRILAQGWEQDPEIGGLPLVVSHGPWWKRRYRLNHRSDNACVFLSKEGRCRIHERFGAEAKPLACRIYPFILVPANDHWRVGLRFACPAVASSRGRPVNEHHAALKKYADELERSPGRGLVASLLPVLQKGQPVEWRDMLHFVQALLVIFRDRRKPFEYRFRLCLALANLCRQARFDKIKGGRLVEFLQLLAEGLEGEVPAHPTLLSPPTWVGKTLFRQAAAVFSRKDRGPGHGLAVQGRRALLGAAWRFALGRGLVPRVHAAVPEVSFERLEEPAGPLPRAAEEVLERYYSVKVESLQFFGPAYFDLPFWEGFQSLALTLPVILWLARAFADLPREEAVLRAIGMVDINFGFNPWLGTFRQRVNLNILAGRGELERLIAWYSR